MTEHSPKIRRLSPVRTRFRQHSAAGFARRGSLMVEMVVCTILLSVVAVVLVPGIHAVHAQRKATRFETLTLIELNNIAAQLTSSDVRTAPELTKSFARRYADAELVIESDEPDDASLVPVRITIRRPNGDAVPDTVRSLVVWIPQSTADTKKESSE